MTREKRTTVRTAPPLVAAAWLCNGNTLRAPFRFEEQPSIVGNHTIRSGPRRRRNPLRLNPGYRGARSHLQQVEPVTRPGQGR